MTWKDKLEIGLKDDAPYRKDNLPEEQVRGAEEPSGPGRSPEVPEARHDAEAKAKKGPPMEEDFDAVKKMRKQPQVPDQDPHRD